MFKEVEVSNVGLGAGFEKYVDKCLSLKGLSVIRIHDGCKVYGPNKLVRVKQAFDFVVAGPEKLAMYFDAKTTIGDSFTFSSIDQDQLRNLLRIEKHGHVAGYIINFRQNGLYCFASAGQLAGVISGSSIKSRDCVDLGREIDILRLFKRESVA